MIETARAHGLAFLDKIMEWAMSPQFYAQVAGIVLALVIGHYVARELKKRVPFFQAPPTEGRLLPVLKWLYAASGLLRPVMFVAFMAIAAAIADAAVGASWLIRIGQSLAIIFVLYSAINQFITHPLVNAAARWVGIPVAVLWAFGWLPPVVKWMKSTGIPLGDATISLYTVFYGVIAGAFLFWIGRHSNQAGQKAIREQHTLDVQVRELLVKLFQIALFAGLAFVLLKVIGFPLGSLAILGGAVGVGLGFGLQQIVSNFISGMILLFERSMGIGDHIELDNGRSGTLKAINLRSSTIETYDGKEIMVPNQTFITEQFINWTRDDPRQRYEVEFSVAYDTDLHKVPPIIVEAVLKHPQVLTDPEQPDCELRGFGDSGVDFGVEFWCSGIDDGPNKFSSDILFLVWDALKENNIEIPYPRREVYMYEGAPKLSVKKKGKAKKGS